jgi:hypothetical protein
MKQQFLHFLKHHIFIQLEYGQSNHQFEYFRVAIALFSLFNLVFLFIDYPVFLDTSGIVHWEVTNASAFWFEPHVLKISNYFNVSATFTLLVSAGCYLLALILLLLGVFTRVTAVVVFCFFLLFSVQLHPFLYGVDLYQSVFLMLLCVFPSGYALSVKPKLINEKLRHQQQIGMRGIQLYLAITYLSAGLGKAQMPSWLNGKFIFMSISDPNYQLFQFPTNLPFYFYIVLGMVVVLIEGLYFVFICIPYIRTLVLVGIIMMHLFISFFMGLVPFGLLLALANVVAWYPLILKDISKVAFFEYFGKTRKYASAFLRKLFDVFYSKSQNSKSLS